MISASLLRHARDVVASTPALVKLGRVRRVTGSLIEASVPDAQIGMLLEISRGGAPVLAEVVGFQGELALIVPLDDIRGIAPGAFVRPSRRSSGVPVSPAVLGRVIDPFGRPLDGGPPIHPYRAGRARSDHDLEHRVCRPNLPAQRRHCHRGRPKDK